MNLKPLESDSQNQQLQQLKQEALELHLSNHFAEALHAYQKVLELEDVDAYTWNNMGMTYYAQGNYEAALESVQQSLSLDDSIYLHHYSLGLILEKLGQFSEASQAYQRSIHLNPTYINAYNNLGNVLVQLEQLDEALVVYQNAIKVNSSHFGSYLNAGNILLLQGELDQALAIYQDSLKIKPNNPDTLYNIAVIYHQKNDVSQAALHLGYSVYYQRQYNQAIEYFELFLANNQADFRGDINFYNALANSYEKLDNFDRVIEIYDQAISIYPNHGTFYVAMIRVLQYLGRDQEAWNWVEKAIEQFPDFLYFRFFKLSLPIVYETVAEIHFYRHRFTQILNELLEIYRHKINELKNPLMQAVSKRTNFFLQYQCQNDLILQKHYGEFVSLVMAANFPDSSTRVEMPAHQDQNRLRIGYVSPNFHSHVVARMCLGWFRHSDRTEVENFCYCIEQEGETPTETFKLYSEHFYHIPRRLDQIIEQIKVDQLHILVFADIGMHPIMTALAGLYLAPIQCTTWAHPITSGLPTIDYFLSSDLMEPENGQEHYSETLVRLPNLGFSYPKPILPAVVARSTFNLNEENTVYLCCQSVYKYLPQHDYIFAEIARQVPTAKFVFIESFISKHTTQKLQSRLQKVFQAYDLDSEAYCINVSRQNTPNYYRLNLCSDIFLDTFSWSGGNTTIDALTCGLPVVTCPGEFMRGRHSYGILRMLGVPETIAQTEAEYIEIAVRLGLDTDWRREISEKIKQNCDRLFNDLECVRGLEAFYQQIVEAKLAHNKSTFTK
jgi:predicted O-linked N-acetylglucosamine transferase (SPINDLY family)